MQDDIQYIMSFWFGEELDDADVAKDRASLWWKKNPETDQLIWAKFEHRVVQACAGELDHWQATAEGRLCCILLIDQFCRHIYRDTPEAFSHDARARTLTLEGLDKGVDQELRPIERVFFYLPLEHSENREHQAMSVELMSRLIASLDSRAVDLFQGFLDYARRHQEVIERFGRFPHRNAILGRPSTPEEQAFLKQPGSSF